ncbi:unannotated protein [freshwater metagenome]|uniref:Unannotated protein n=1 Tax=freshwater metagenome TaxID=449393 RepID=A0A6J7XTF5_9ZZZZ|nr:UDP-glucose 4-epimerase GalE [Actinomycetota bacterium]
MRILVTGGAGYIGATAVAILLSKGFEVSVLDDCSTGHKDSIPENVRFIRGSILDSTAIEDALTGCNAVMHFAGKSLVSESVEKPDLYRNVNIEGTRLLLEQMQYMGLKKIVFSSSASTYGDPAISPTPETQIGIPTNPYGESKLAVDEMLARESSVNGISAISLRYFNVAGAININGQWLAERHNPETHLIPMVLRSKPDEPVKIFGTDWPTPDGTCIRDYVHVIDLVDAHVSALNSLDAPSHTIINVGGGIGYSVREVITASSRALGYDIPTVDASRRQGDPAILVADISRAKSLLNWEPVRNLEDMVRDTAHSIHPVR